MDGSTLVFIKTKNTGLWYYQPPPPPAGTRTRRPANGDVVVVGLRLKEQQ
jgi:hypothetical protein